MRTHRQLVSRHAHWHEIGSEDPAAQTWIALHGYGQLAARFLRRFSSIAGSGRRIVAPEGLSRFYLDGRYERVGASWMTREDRDAEIVDTVAWLDLLHARRAGGAGRVVVVGFSQGAPVAGRWLARSPVRVDHLVCWGGGMPHDVDLAEFARARPGLALTLVAGETDPWLSPTAVQTEIERLSEGGLEPVLHRYAGGHEVDPVTLRRIAAAISGTPDSL